MGRILDARGQPIDQSILRAPQTAELANLRREFANHPVKGLTPARLARIMEAAERGEIIAQHELFADMEERDGHILAEMSKRKRGLLSLDWDIEPPRNASAKEKDDAEWLKEVVQDIENLDAILFDVLDAIGHGFSASEVTWERAGNEWRPAAIERREPTWFQIHPEQQNALRLRDNSAYGAALQPFGWVLHVHKAKSGYLARTGLHRALAWTYIFKFYGVRDFAEMLEIYGIPLRIGKYPTGAGDDERRTLLRAVTELGHAAAGIMPQGMEIELIQATAGAGEPHMAMIKWCEQTQSKAILGGTLTSQADGKTSTNALGNVHEQAQRDIQESDATQVAATLRRDLLYPLLALNRGVTDPRRLPRWKFDIAEADDIATMADALPKLVGVGAQIPRSYVNERLKIPVPKEGEEVLHAAPPPPNPFALGPAPGAAGEGGPPGGKPGDNQPPKDPAADPPGAPPPGGTVPKAKPAALKGAALLTALTAALAQPAPDPDAIDLLVDQALDEWQPTMQSTLAPFEAALTTAIAEGLTAAQFRDRLPQLLPQMDLTQITEQLARAQFLARLVGESGTVV